MQLVATAYHEAGHAFLSYVLGKGFQRVTVIPDQDYLGAVTNMCDYDFLANLMMATTNFIVPDSVIDNRVKNELMVLYAGYLAEKEYGVDNKDGASSDLEMIREFIFNYCNDEDESTALITLCLETTTTILKDNWFQIRVLANVLIEKKTMTFSDVDELFKSLKNKNFIEIKKLEMSLH